MKREYLDGLDGGIIRPRQFYEAYEQVTRITRLVPRAPVRDNNVNSSSRVPRPCEQRAAIREWADPDLAMLRAVARLPPTTLSILREAALRLYVGVGLEPYRKAAAAAACLPRTIKRCANGLGAAKELAGWAFIMSFPSPIGEGAFLDDATADALRCAREDIWAAVERIERAKQAMQRVWSKTSYFKRVEGILKYTRVRRGVADFIRFVMAANEGVLPPADASSLAYFAIGASITPPCRGALDFRNRVATWRTALRRARKSSKSV